MRARSVLLTDEQVVIRHAYIERRVIPLDMYLRDSGEDLAAAAIVDYGAAIKELGATGIFPGDLLLKNFGVTRHGRVVFYDYDELTTIDKVVFRRLPEDESMGDEPTFGVGPDDVFPEEFIRFLGVDGELKRAFLHNHRDLLTADWWLRGAEAGRGPRTDRHLPLRGTAAERAGLDSNDGTGRLLNRRTSCSGSPQPSPGQCSFCRIVCRSARGFHSRSGSGDPGTVLTGQPHFAAGADIKGFQAAYDGGTDDAPRLESGRGGLGA